MSNKASNPLMTELLGSTLLSSKGNVSTSEALASKKAIGLYFSAHWCPPCRGFTPALAKAYTEHLNAKGLEIIFVSSDRDESSFTDYFKEMPWLALPFEARDLKAKLSKKYKVSGIPSFVILDGETGETITTDGRDSVSDDPTGKDFPWKPPSVWESLGTEFLSGSDGDTVELDEVKRSAKYIGLYFSAHWCPPCRGFTPALAKSYTEHLKAKGLEIIFVSSDRDQKSFMEYFQEMPWLAIPQGDARKGKLSKLFGVDGIPSFVIVDATTGETVTTDARGSVRSDPEGAEFPWYPPALNNISAGQGLDGINEELSLCVMLEGCEQDVKDAAKAVLQPIAEARKAAKEDTLFYYAPSSDGPTGKIRELTQLGEPSATPKLVLLDIPDSGGFYVSEATEVTADTVNTFLDMYKAGSLVRKQLE